jgi:glutaredoxin 3
MKLEFFYFEACPFCQLVLEVIQDLDLKVDMLDISVHAEHFQRLVSDTGRRTVPCLYIDNDPMFESGDIINWLQTNRNNISQSN